MTESEELFEEFCHSNCVVVEKVVPESEKTPDYLVRHRDAAIIVEVKQFDATAAERRTLLKSPDELDESDAFYDGRPGDGVRSKINSAMPQLKRLSGGKIPTLLVLYDNVQLWPEICDAYAIKVAMYGVESILITPEPAPEGGATVVARWHGPRRKATRLANTSLSAIALLLLDGERLRMNIFHNFFARNPLSPVSLRSSSITHYRLPADPDHVFAEWEIFDSQ
ncbi:MAG: hypothetical protein LAN70_15460 [Acidobacteriia bacterium]|nr:hypothetical protein [Terriglobia bacterium]